MDKFIKWTGGECPVSGETFVSVVLNGNTAAIHSDMAKFLDWSRKIPKEDWIVKYKVMTK